MTVQFPKLVSVGGKVTGKADETGKEAPQQGIEGVHSVCKSGLVGTGGGATGKADSAEKDDPRKGVMKVPCA